MDPMVEQHNREILEDAKKRMFAEDLICTFMTCRGQDTNNWRTITGENRRIVEKAYTKMIDFVTIFLYVRISIYYTFSSFEANRMLTKGAFLLFAQHLENRYFHYGYNPEKFLYFCSHLGYMVTMFHENVQADIPNFAANYIVKLMKTFKVPESQLWNGLNMAAFRYLKIVTECGYNHSQNIGDLYMQLRVSRKARDHYFPKTAPEDDKTNAESEKNSVKKAAELRKWIATIDYDSVRNRNKGKIRNLVTLYHEVRDKESSDSNEPESENLLEYGDIKKPYPEIISLGEISPNRKEDISALFDKLIIRSMSDDPPLAKDFLESHKMQQKKKEAELPESVVKIACSEKLPPSVTTINFGASTSSDKSNFEFQSAVSSEGEFSYPATIQEPTTETTSEELKNAAESELASEELVTVNLPINHKMVFDMLELSQMSNLHEKWHIEFLRTEDDFNATFDILTTIHYMASNTAMEVLDIANMG